MPEKRVAILLYDQVEVLDFAGPFEVFSVASQQMGGERLEVFTVAENQGAVRAIGGLAVLAEHTIAGSPTPDILVVPGVARLFGEMAAWRTAAYMEYDRPSEFDVRIRRA
jgi:transcriptional regulator GlxA family with amidase domain